MTERYGQFTRLGVYMRSVGKALTDQPMNAAAAYEAMRPSLTDVPYAQATMMRLAERGIAKEVEGGFVRGEHWTAAARYYGWK